MSKLIERLKIGECVAIRHTLVQMLDPQSGQIVEADRFIAELKDKDGNVVVEGNPATIPMHALWFLNEKCL